MTCSFCGQPESEHDQFSGSCWVFGCNCMDFEPEQGPTGVFITFHSTPIGAIIAISDSDL